MNRDRREFPRAETGLGVWIQEGSCPYVRARALELSVSGAQVETCQPLGVGTPLTLEFELGSTWRVRARGKVVWSRPVPGGSHVAGISMRILNRADRHLLGPWVHKAARLARAV
ncbi:MAG: PilZ domain-containing protein [Candidatus Eremiobacterota bacterium]